METVNLHRTAASVRLTFGLNMFSAVTQKITAMKFPHVLADSVA
jgi:hypothetical protein